MSWDLLKENINWNEAKSKSILKETVTTKQNKH